MKLSLEMSGWAQHINLNAKQYATDQNNWTKASGLPFQIFTKLKKLDSPEIFPPDIVKEYSILTTCYQKFSGFLQE